MGVGVLLPPCELRFTLKARLWASDLCRHWAGLADSTARLYTLPFLLGLGPWESYPIP